jgi:hypothetical protein
MPPATDSRRAVVDTLNHRQPGRVPLDLGGTSVTGMHVSTVAALRDYYGLERRPVKVLEPFQMLGMFDEDLKQALGVDVEGVFRRVARFGFPNENWKPWRLHGLEVLVPEKFRTTTDTNGDALIYPQGDTTVPPCARMPKDGWFFDAIIRQPPIDEDRLDPADNTAEFQPLGDEDVRGIAEDVAAANRTGRAVIANFGGTSFGDIAQVPGPALKHPAGIRDVAEWYISTRSRRGYIHQVFERQCEVALGNLARIHQAIGDSVDAVYVCGTDFGTQTSAFCSVATFRELWFPYYREVCGWIHRNTAWKCFKHCCGSAERFIDSFIEAGFDILNPIQCSAANMQPEHLKAKYGGRIVFWGGGVDTQHTLPFGTPAQVREEALRRLEVFAPGGGYVFNAIHNIQAATPVANIAAMIDALREFNGVPGGKGGPDD